VVVVKSFSLLPKKIMLGRDRRPVRILISTSSRYSNLQQ
jgi:hypothetical protein